MTAPHAQAQPLFPLVIGVPDDGKATVRLLRNGSLAYELAGNARVATDLGSAVKQRMLRTVCGPGIPLRLPPVLQTAPLVNSIGDADTCTTALQMLETYRATHDAPCFNHPSSLLGTAREHTATKLAPIDGILAPRTLRLQIAEPSELLAAIAREDLRWPLIVRVAGTHSGKAMVRIDTPASAHVELQKLAWGGHALYVTEYVDYRDPDGHFRKCRLALVGDEIFIRHHIVADRWMIHFRDRDLRYLPEEEAALQGFETRVLPSLADRLHALADVIDLDYTGIDCNLRPDGQLLIFEVNPLMDILTNTIPGPNCWDEPVRRIRGALEALLTHPARWRYPAGHA